MNSFTLRSLAVVTLLSGCLMSSALAVGLADLTNQDASRGIKGALVASMNQAAEQAVPEAKELMTNAVKAMSVEDAKGILTGGDDSVTKFFRAKTAAPLAVKFLPIVKQTTARLGLAQKYDQFAGQGAKLGLIKGDAGNIEQYVTDKTLDGLYFMIGEEEHTIRQNPAAAGSAIVSKVFGALR